MSDVIHKDLKLKCFKKRRAQELTVANKLSRLVCAKQLLKRYPEHAVNFIWFSDEKVFTVAPPINLQNDRVYASRRNSCLLNDFSKAVRRSHDQ